jgi:hypothetical protein
MIETYVNQLKMDNEDFTVKDFNSQQLLRFSFYRKLCSMSSRVQVFNDHFCNKKTKYEANYMRRKIHLKPDGMSVRTGFPVSCKLGARAGAPSSLPSTLNKISGR